MKKIYVDNGLSWVFNGYKDVTVFNSTNQIPKNCDCAAISVFNNYIEEFKSIADLLLSRSNFVLIDLNEPTNDKLVDLVESYLHKHSNLEVVSMILPNYPSKIKFSGFWFMSPINFYADTVNSAWAKNSLSLLNTQLKNRPYMVDCLLGVQRTHRDIIENLYKKSSLKEKIFFSYYKSDITKGVWDFSVTGVQISSEIVKYNDDFFTPSSIIPYSIYNQSYYSIVAETTTSNNYSFFTEKIAKPLLAKRPFVVFSGKHYLKNLKKLGFKTFSEVIDESYDSIDDEHQRMVAAWKQIEFLMTQDPELVYDKTNEAREHNHKLFKLSNWTNVVDDIIYQWTT
jgi:hypothetical protein